MELQLDWTDPTTGELQRRQLETPVGLGRNLDAIPETFDGKQVTRIALEDSLIADYHALIDENDGELLIVDQDTPNGTYINNVELPSSTLLDGDRLRIGSYQIQIRIGKSINLGGCDRMIGFLFKHRCERKDPTGCSYCQNGQEETDPYFYDRSYYSDYGYYNNWGRDYYHRRDNYYYNTDTRSVDFTDADAASLASESDTDYEQNMGAS